MTQAFSITGYPPDNINYCPECASEHIHFSNGLLICLSCRLHCHIVESDLSHVEFEEAAPQSKSVDALLSMSRAKLTETVEK